MDRRVVVRDRDDERGDRPAPPTARDRGHEGDQRDRREEHQGHDDRGREGRIRSDARVGRRDDQRGNPR